LNFLYESNTDHSNFDYLQLQNYTSPVSPSSGNTSSSPGRIRETGIEISYSQPVTKDFTLETGAKAFFKTINSNTDLLQFDPAANQYILDPTQSYHFRYDRNVYAYYLSASFKAFNFLDVKAGGRYEYTFTSADFPNTKIPGYGTFNPSFTISHQIDQSQLIKLSYSHRIERPDYDDLNPFINRSDPYNIFTGNPNLKPELGNNFELGYSKSFKKGAALNITTFYRHNGNDIQTYTIFYPTYQEGNATYNNVSFTQRTNTGAEIRTGGNIYANIPITDKLSIRSNILISRKSILYNYNGVNQDSKGMEYRMNLNAAYDFPKDLSAEVFANYNTPRVGLQGKNSAFVYYMMAVRKQFLDKKASIGLTATDPFNQYINQSNIIMQAGDRQYALRQVPYRSFGITMSYKFGKLKFDKEEPKDNPTIPTL
jgi:ferric enterobactin receptor